ncbi:toll/interleukin-1 receptor domain-containing protein [Leptolyngbya sp. GGD]|uniref:toll/interleukin-1 receptor domain-containing protein n=1 Tax=Leptolyngbya sp. GGD TaxID=2997907 RepID=UPI00227BB696|nr:toll/interleukin-1 receptor domain-containing protein [Leptolyngbya sp. GGD]MCY6494077.1 toll/interleukin-1 receptor domain-containing protein [Leptolyngbya sp. GGD]
MSITVFFSYAHEDESLRDKLANHLSILKRLGKIEAWHDRQILPSNEWDKQINTHLETANIILLLISDDFLASDYCWDVEVNRAMVRHEAKEACVIPIILRPCDWQGAPFGKLQGLPRDMRPVTTWDNIDSAFTDIAKGIRRLAEELGKLQSEAELPTLQNRAYSAESSINQSDSIAAQNTLNISNSSITNMVVTGSIHYNEGDAKKE